jgi:hypothetical protein
LSILPRQGPLGTCLSPELPCDPYHATLFVAAEQAAPQQRGFDVGVALIPPFWNVHRLTVSSFGNEEALARLMTQDRDAARLMAHQDRGPDGAAQRSSHTGERRSPPSEASENRRRTRARHGSFRASSSAGPLAGRPPTSHTAGGPSPPQQSPPRERVMPPGLSHWAHQFPLDPNGPLTMPMARQSVPSSQRAYFSHMNLGRPPSFFPPMESQGMTSNHMVLGSSSLNHPFNSSPYPGPSNGGPAGTASTPPSAYPGGPPQAATFSQQLPPVVALESSFTVPSTTDNGGSNAAGGEGMLQ